MQQTDAQMTSRDTTSATASSVEDIEQLNRQSQWTPQYAPVRAHDEEDTEISSSDRRTSVRPYLVPPEVEQEQIRIARKLFYGGLVCLPWLWAVSLFYFRRKVFNLNVSTELRRWLIYSMFCLLTFTIAFITWVSLYQTKHKNWGETGSDLTLYKDNTLWFQENGPWREP